MILDIMVFTLGFLVAGLLALAALPVIWRRALRLSGERLSRLVPLSAKEIAADRDHLRASHAVDLRRAEQKHEAAEAERAALMAELPRRDARILALDAEATRAKVEIAALQAERAELQRDVDRLQADYGAATIALHGALGLADERWLAIAALEAARQGLEEQIDRYRGTMAGLETRLLGASTLNEDVVRDLEHARQETLAAHRRAAAAEIERDGARDAAGALAARRDEAEARLRARDQEFEAMAARLASLGEQASAAEREVVKAAQTRQAIEAERAEWQRRHDAVVEARAAEAEAARESERKRTALVEELRADKAALASALAAARSEVEQLRTDLATARRSVAAAGPSRPEAGAATDDVGRLRVAIDALADDILRVTRPAPPKAMSPPEDAALPAPRAAP